MISERNRKKNINTKKTRHSRKKELVHLHGGKCSICGYDKNYAALQFHHLRDKSFNLTVTNLANRTWNALLKEAEKCILLCANCHSEHHYPNSFKIQSTSDLSISNLPSEKSTKYFSEEELSLQKIPTT